MKKNGFFLNVGLVIVGTIIGLCLAEAILDLGGKILLCWQNSAYSAISNHSVPSVNVKKNFKILCLGDSSTYGSGVRTIYSYPYQLSKLLNQHSSSYSVSVISSGGMNSSQFADRYERFLKTDNYDLVIFQAGINDVHNFRECNIPIYTKHRVWQWLAGSRLFNLVKMCFSGPKGSLKDINFRHPERYGVGSLMFLDKGSLYELYRHNISKIAVLSQKNNVMLWVQDYHTVGWLRPETILYKVYKELGLEVIHQKEIFDYAKGIRMRGKDKWHPNRYGYFVIARLIYNNMVDHGIVQGKKYDLRLEIDRIRDYIRNKRNGYQYLVDGNGAFDEIDFIKTIKNIVPGFDDPGPKAGNFRINGIYDFD